MKEIKNLNPSSAVLSQNDYTYNAVGTIATWQQQTDSNTPVSWAESYDSANQLTGAVLTNTAIASPAIRTLTGSTPSGSRTEAFTGSVNGADTVTVNGSSATVNTSHDFSGTTSFTPGVTNMLATVPVVATDTHGNQRTNHYQTTVPAELTYSPTFDADGNELTNGAGQTYAWDAKNELVTITQSTNTYTFGYDALGHRISETDNGTLVKQWVWDGTKMAQERNSSNYVQKRFYPQGEQVGTSSYYYTRDHLGSVREMTDSTGAIQARYDYDPYGRTTLVSGTNLSDFQYAGYYSHQPSGLNLTLFRAYDPNTARWLSRDPEGEGSDATLYSYVANDPIDGIDPLGLNVYITQGGKTTSVSNATDLINQINNAGPGTITDINFVGHGNSVNQFFNYGDNPDYLAIGKNDTVYINNAKTGTATPIGPLEGKLAPNATIELNGCHTGNGPNSITQAVAKNLPGHVVTGSYYSRGAIPGTDITIPTPWMDGFARGAQKMQR